MKIPKEIKNPQNTFTFKQSINELICNFKDFLKYNYAQKEKYLLNLLERTNPVSSKIIYPQLRKYSSLILNDIGFKCNRCTPSCCNFKQDEFIIREVSIYLEDYNILKENQIDTKGYLTNCPQDYFESHREQLNSFFQKAKIPPQEINYEKYTLSRRKARNMLGYFKRLHILKRGDKYPCYYYDFENNKCKIHNKKPLVCITYPLRIQNTSEKFGILKCEDCFWLKNQIKRLGKEGFTDFIESFLNYWLYLFLIWLYLRSKGRFNVIDGEVINKKEIKNIYFR